MGRGAAETSPLREIIFSPSFPEDNGEGDGKSRGLFQLVPHTLWANEA